MNLWPYIDWHADYAQYFPAGLRVTGKTDGHNETTHRGAPTREGTYEVENHIST